MSASASDARSRPPTRARRRSPKRPPREIVHEVRSALSGLIRVVDRGDERLLVVRGVTLSSISHSGDWQSLGHEYWSRALDMASLPARPTALFVGLGGGTQLRMLAARCRPRWITAVERDPIVLSVARRYFGLDDLPRTEFLCAAIERALPQLEAAERRFDFVMEDAAYADDLRTALPIARRLAALVSRRGTIVFNRHARGHAAETADALRDHFAHVTVRRVRLDGENVLIAATNRRGGVSPGR